MACLRASAEQATAVEGLAWQSMAVQRMGSHGYDLSLALSRCGLAAFGVARQSSVRLGGARLGTAWLGAAQHSMVFCRSSTGLDCMASRGLAGLGTAMQGSGPYRDGTHSEAWHGRAEQRSAARGVARDIQKPHHLACKESYGHTSSTSAVSVSALRPSLGAPHCQPRAMSALQIGTLAGTAETPQAPQRATGRASLGAAWLGSARRRGRWYARAGHGAHWQGRDRHGTAGRGAPRECTAHTGKACLWNVGPGAARRREARQRMAALGAA